MTSKAASALMHNGSPGDAEGGTWGSFPVSSTGTPYQAKGRLCWGEGGMCQLLLLWSSFSMKETPSDSCSVLL